MVAPVGLPLWPLSLHPHYAPLRALPRQESLERARSSTAPATGSGRSSARAGTARRMADALLPLLREIRARLPVRRDRRRILLARRAGGDASGRGARRALLDQGARQRHPSSGAPGPASPGRSSRPGRAAGGLLAVSARAQGRHGGARHAGGADPGPPYRHRPRPLPARSTAPRPRRRSASRGRCWSPPARCIARKGQELAIEALAQIPDATLILVGDGPDRRGSGAAGAAARPGTRVRFLGVRPHDELPALLAAADVDGAADRRGRARQRLGRGARLRHAGGDQRRRRRPRGRSTGRKPAGSSRATRRRSPPRCANCSPLRPTRRRSRKARRAFSWEQERRRAASTHLCGRWRPLERHQRGGDPAALAAEQAPGAGGGAAVHRLDADAARLERARRRRAAGRPCAGPVPSSRNSGGGSSASTGSTCAGAEIGRAPARPTPPPARASAAAPR